MFLEWRRGEEVPVPVRKEREEGDLVPTLGTEEGWEAGSLFGGRCQIRQREPPVSGHRKLFSF